MATKATKTSSATTGRSQTSRATTIKLSPQAIKKAAAELGIDDITRIPQEVVIVSSKDLGRHIRQDRVSTNVVVVMP